MDQTCRVGGLPPFNKDHCPGPCDLHALKKGIARFDSPLNPSVVYRRGQKIRVTYQRNNHGPGGFTRLSIVPWNQMMNKQVHKRNAFHYSCWGANAVIAKRSQKGLDNMRFSLVGNDGEEHRFPPAFYVTNAIIPDCIPDGCYVFGWVWFGGTGSDVHTAARQQKPLPYGFFGDYYSCSSIRIQGGKPLRRTCSKRFVNDMSKYSSKGCMSSTDEVGVCAREPCRKLGFYRKPREFAKSKAPLLHSHYFSGRGYDAKKTCSNGNNVGMSACHCMNLGFWCAPDIARRTKGACAAKKKYKSQKSSCRVECCKFCRSSKHAYCGSQLVRGFMRRMGKQCK